MSENIFPKLIEPAELAEQLNNPKLLILDLCQEALYAQKHISGAIHISPSELMCGIPPAAGKLPETAHLQELFNRIGLTPEHHVIAYDDEGGGWAGRLIWTLEVIGHTQWSYLNGGIIAWLDEELKTSQAIPKPTPSNYPIKALNQEPIAEIADILHNLENNSGIVWDARSFDEYSGARQLAQQGGHIPGAIHCEWTQLMDPSRGLRIRTDALEYLNAIGITPGQPTITHCQSHHRSGFTYLVAKILEFKNIKGYHGSWSEWGNTANLPVETL